MSDTTDTLATDVAVFHEIVHGTEDTVTTEAGAIRTVTKIMADIQAQADAILPDVTPTAQTAATGLITAQKGVAGGLVPLGGDSKIAAQYLPSYVDDVLEFINVAAFPGTGETGKIYVDTTANAQYRWSGTVYVQLTASPGSTDAVPEGATNKYFTSARVLASALTGYAAAGVNSAVAATDTVLAAFGKLQKQVTDLGTANTGDETTAGIRTKLGIVTLSGVNTGDQTLAGLGGVATTLIGAANGIVPLGSDTKIAAAFLPSYVDDVLEFANVAGFPSTGETGKIYVALDTNKTYRWSGSAYIQLVSSPGTTDAVTEGTTNLYFTVARVLGSVLTGLAAGANSTIVATDSVLGAFAKLQAQITANKSYTSLTGMPYDFTTTVFGKPAASAVVVRAVAARAFTLPITLGGSKVVAGTAAAASATFSVLKNGAAIGTVVIAAGATTATFTAASATSFAIGDVLTVTAPATQDSTLADIAMTFLATLN